MTRLLIVDDDPLGLYLLQVLLEGNGFEVIIANNGQEALAHASSNPPHLIISDILMPEMDGFTLCRTWKRDPRLQDIPFVFYTATYTDHRDEEFALSLGADKFIVKPAEPDDFIAIIRQVLQDLADGRLTPARIPEETADDTVLQAYNMALVRKLEDKMLALEHTHVALQQKHNQLLLLRELDKAISESLALDAVLDRLADGLMRLLAINRCSVWLLEPDGQFLRGRGYGREIPEPDVSQILLPSDTPLVAQVFRTQRPLAVPDVHDPEFEGMIDPQYIKTFNIFAFLIAPLVQSEKVVGFLVLDDTHGPRTFSQDEVKLVESVATQAVVAIEKARLFTAVSDSEAHYRKIFEGFRDAVLVEDRDGNILEANETACKLYGYTRADLLAKQVRDLVAPEFPVLMAENIITPDQPFIPVRSMNIRANGERFPVELTATMQHLGGQDVMLVAVRDISARLEAESQLRLQSAALEASANAIFITDTNGMILWVNKAFTDLTGYEPAEILGKTPRLLKSGEHDEAFYTSMWQTILSGRVWQGKLVNRCKDGTLYLDEQTITPVMDEQGVITNFVTIKQNVTHREQAAAALAEYATRLEGLHVLDHAILESVTPGQLANLALDQIDQLIPCTGAGVVKVDSEAGVVEVLARRGDTAVLPPVGTKISMADFDYTALGPPYSPVLIDDLTQTTHQAQELNRLLAAEVGTFLHVPILVSGKLLGMIQLGASAPGTFTETHLQMAREMAAQLAVGWHNAALAAERKRRTREMEAVAKASAILRRAEDRASMPPVILDILLELFQASGAALAMLDTKTRETFFELGRGNWEVWTDIRLAANEGFTGHVIATGKPYVNANVLTDPIVVMPDLHQGVTAVACVPLISEEKTIGALAVGRNKAFTEDELGILNALTDLTANAIQRASYHDQTVRYAAELEDRVAARTRQLAKANEQLKELDRLKSKFVSDVSHELRTPITNLNLYLELLKRGSPDHQSRYLEILRIESERLGQLVEDILNLSRLEMGKSLAPAFRQLDFNDLIKQVIIANQPQAASRHLHLDFNAAPDLPLVLAEPNQLTQVATNLITNAINYTPQGFVRVSTYFEVENSQVCLEVLDTGLGIPEEDQKHMFDRFYRGTEVGQLNIPGTGLGLSIAHEIVALHGGTISVESEPGQGSRFLVCLPVFPEEEE